MAGVEVSPTKNNCDQCPHIQSKSAVAPTDTGLTTLSKSKKKRLRKKKKVVTETPANEVSAEIPKSVGKDAKSSKTREVYVQSSCKNSILGEAEVKLSKNSKLVVEHIEESCAIVEPGVRKSTPEKVEVNSKQKVIQASREEDSTKCRTKSLNSKPVICQGSTSVAMDSDKSQRDDVKAQREAKKLAKSAKKKSAGGLTQMAPAQPDASVKQMIKNTVQKVQMPNSVPIAQNSFPVSEVTSQMNQISLDSVDGEIVKPVRSVGHVVPPAVKTGPTSGDKMPSGVLEKSEKSREEILAEREAKKLAKLAGKTKKKDGVIDQPKESQMAAVNDKSAVTILEVSGSDPQKDVNHVENDGSTTQKSKAALKAERRAKQEAQRAAKGSTQKDTDKTKPSTGAPAVKPESIKEKSASTRKAPSKPQISKTSTVKSSRNQPKLLSHLLTDKKPLPVHIYQNVHPAIVELGAKYAARVVSGSNARCIALLQALKRVIVDFVTPREKEFSRAMETRLNDSMVYLNSSRQSSVSMTNALKHVKSHLTQLTTEKTSDDDARKKLCEVIDTFIKEQIDVAGEAISLAVAQKISNGDTIAIYGCSSLLLRILVESHNEGKDFEVVVVDGGPLYEGREMCRRLVSENIKCTYVLLPAFSYIVGQTTKVLLGAHALLANGCVMSRSGTALVAMLAKTHNVPVIVCCETYKFCERVQADAFVHNELGPQDKVSSPPSISLMYDMTPPTLVDAVATELAILPCTSVPVILRVKPSDVSSYYY